MSEFKVGDVVKRIRWPNYLDQPGEVPVGTRATVIGLAEGGVIVSFPTAVANNGPGQFWLAEYTELVQRFAPGDKVRVLTEPRGAPSMHNIEKGTITKVVAVHFFGVEVEWGAEYASQPTQFLHESELQKVGCSA